ncbi:MAG: uridine kinase [Firmicutes bacterium HGW-Firmicutes-11]|nr:MAG: uridine kinase [Firmicutes bacterium HGW-Firmicutes-11]
MTDSIKEWSMEEAIAEVNRRIEIVLLHKEAVVVGIDGRSAAGKSWLAERLAQERGAGLIRMDHFFLQTGQRTEARLAETGGNFDQERFLFEVIDPLRKGEDLHYQEYDCRDQKMKKWITIPRNKVTVVEGAYSLHPLFRDVYDISAFLTVDKETQSRRIFERNGVQQQQRFLKEWIPMEERYIKEMRVDQTSDLLIRLRFD